MRLLDDFSISLYYQFVQYIVLNYYNKFNQTSLNKVKLS